MARNSEGGSSKPTRHPRPSTTPEGRENQMVALAYDLVERRMRDGSATSQETTHFLKLGSAREQLEQDRLRNENSLTQAKIDAMQGQKRIEELYSNAISAMNTYQGRESASFEDE